MAKPIAILTDSASDITPKELSAWQVKLIPMTLALDGKDSFADDHTQSMAQLWARMEAGAVLTTSQPSLQTFLDAFEGARDRGESVLYVSISSSLSGTYQTAQAAASMVDYDDVHIVDARRAAASAAEKLLVWRACKLRDQGTLTAGEIAGELEKLRDRVRLFACIDTLEYLVRGGRLSKLAGNLGTLLSIKPSISFTPEGKISVVKKSTGLKRAASDLCELIRPHRADTNFPVIPLFAKDPTNCHSFLAQLKEKVGLTTVTPPQEIGATIGCYIGPGGFGLTYVEAEG